VRALPRRRGTAGQSKPGRAASPKPTPHPGEPSEAYPSLSPHQVRRPAALGSRHSEPLEVRLGPRRNRRWRPGGRRGATSVSASFGDLGPAPGAALRVVPKRPAGRVASNAVEGRQGPGVCSARMVEPARRQCRQHSGELVVIHAGRDKRAVISRNPTRGCPATGRPGRRASHRPGSPIGVPRDWQNPNERRDRGQCPQRRQTAVLGRLVQRSRPSMPRMVLPPDGLAPCARNGAAGPNAAPREQRDQ